MLKTAFMGASSVLAVIASGYATQATAATASAVAANAGTVGELVVTAEKREQSLQSVPVAITAFSAQQRSLMGIQILQDIADFSPSVNWTDIDDRIYIRGIGRNSDNLNNTSGVAIYYNGIYYGANAGIELQKSDLFVGNIEVDNGPQNTLHGSNADGGVVEFTSQRPTDTLYGEARVGVANYDTWFTEAAVSGPINDHLKFRLGANYTSQQGGFFKNLAPNSPQGGNLVLGGGGETHYFEGQLEGHWDHLDAWFMASSGNFIANTHGAAGIGAFPTTPFNNSNTLTPSSFYGLCGLAGFAATANGAGCNPLPGLNGGVNFPSIVPGSVRTTPVNASGFPGNNPGNLDPRHFINPMNGVNDMEGNVQLSAHVTYHLPTLDIVYLGGYQNFHYVLNIPDQAISGLNAGVTRFQENGAANAAEALSCTLAGNSLGACESPLTIFPSPNFLIFNEYDQAFSHELNFISTDNSPFQYIGGLYWYRERYHQPVDAYTTTQQGQMFYPQYYNLLGPFTPTGDTCPGGLFATCAAPINPTMAGSSDQTAITYDSLAIFGQFSYKFNDQFKFTGGIRYTNDHKSGWQTWRVISFNSIVTANGDNGPNPPGFLQGWGSATPALDITSLAACQAKAAPLCETAYPGAGPTIINPISGNAERHLGATWGAVTGQAILDWTPSPDTLVYAKYSRGYKSGGWSTYTLAPNPEVGPEFVDAFEIGAKQQFGKTLTANGDIFYYNYYGEQVPLSVVNTVTGQIVPILYNIPQARNYGLELWGTWRPIDPLTLSLSYSYLSAKITKSACVQDTTDPQAIQPGANTVGCGNIPGAQSIVGQTIPGATPNKLTFNAMYTWSFDPGKLTLSGTFVWRDGTYDDVFNRWYTFQPSSTQVNLRLTWNDAKDRFTVIAFCDNLFDTTAYDGAAGVLLQNILPDAPNGIAAHEQILSAPFLNAPRTFGLQFQYRWR